LRGVGFIPRRVFIRSCPSFRRKEIIMAALEPISSERHAGKGWRAPRDFAFVAKQATVPLILSEFSVAALSMPIGFIERGGHYVPAALMSPVIGRNLFIGAGGEWLGSYIPAVIRGFPFQLAKVEGSSQLTLCIDEGAGLVEDIQPGVEPFFDASGQPAEAGKRILDYLLSIEAGRVATQLAVSSLAEAQVIRPWKLQIPFEGRTVEINDLFCVDEAALHAVDDAVFIQLRHTGAIALSYMQMVSMRHIAIFDRLRLNKGQQPEGVHKSINMDDYLKSLPSETLRFN
jgi:hypothetical protein